MADNFQIWSNNTTKQERTMLLLLFPRRRFMDGDAPGCRDESSFSFGPQTSSILSFFFSSSSFSCNPSSLTSLYTFFFFKLNFIGEDYRVRKNRWWSCATLFSWCCPCYCYSNWKEDKTGASSFSFLSCFLVLSREKRREMKKKSGGIALYSPIYGDQVHLWRPFFFSYM